MNCSRSTQRLEQTISTIFACRSVIKYNSVLNGEQKDELIADIDICLRSLRTGFTNDTSAQTILPHPQFQQVGKMTPIPTTEKTDKDISWSIAGAIQIYHAYIDTKQSNNIGTLVVRFDAAISALNEVQLCLNKYYDVHVISSKDPLHAYAPLLPISIICLWSLCVPFLTYWRVTIYTSIQRSSLPLKKGSSHRPR